MVSGEVRIRVCLLAVGFLLAVFFPTQMLAQGTVYYRTISFDGPPIIPPGTDVGVSYYYEDSVTFTPISSGGLFGRAGGGRAAFPENDTAFILNGFNDTLAGFRAQIPSPSRFGLYSVDLAEFSTFYEFPAVVEFVGYRFDGGVVTTEFTTDGVIDGTGPLADFQTFYFDDRFSDLVRFEVPTHTYAMDNLVFFDVIPEPSVFALAFAGGLLFFTRRLFQ